MQGKLSNREKKFVRFSRSLTDSWGVQDQSEKYCWRYGRAVYLSASLIHVDTEI